MSSKPTSEVTAAQRLVFAEKAWGWVPHGGQVQVICSGERNKVIVCGRRWGKSESGAVDDVTCMLSHPGWVSMVVAPSRDQVMINYKAAKDLLERCADFKGLYKCKETPHPEIVMGDRMILYRTGGDDGKYIRGHGKKMRRVRVDEAGYVKQSVIEGVIQPMCLDEGAGLILQGTPFGKNYFYRRYLEGLADDSKHDPYTRSFHYPTTTNPHLDMATFERTKRQLGADSLQFRCEYLAEFVETAGSVFPFELIQRCFYEDDKKSDYERYVCGIDLARYSDYTVVSVAGHDRGMVKLVDVDRFNQDDWLVQKSRIYDTVHKYGAYGCIDASGSGDSVVDDLIRGEFIPDGEGNIKNRPGLPLEPVRITSNQVKRELVDKCKLWMGKGLVKFPYPSVDASTGDGKWDVFVDELKYYTYELTESGKVTFQADSGFHDDCVMSLALLVKKAFGEFEKVEPEMVLHPDSFGYFCKQIDEAEKRKEREIIHA